MKNPAAVSLGRMGGKATAKAMTPDELKARAAKAGAARWAGKTEDERKAHARLMQAGRKPKA